MMSSKRKQRKRLLVNLVPSSMSGEFCPWEGSLIQTVVPLPFPSFLEMPHILMDRLTKGDDTLRKLEQLPTRREGIFVMPVERISILSTYYYDVDLESCEAEKSILRRRLSESASEVERWRRKCFA